MNQTKIAVRTTAVLILLTIFCFAGAMTAGAQGRKAGSRSEQPLWQRTDAKDIVAKGRRLIVPNKYLVFKVAGNVLAETLAAAPVENSRAAKRAIIEVPTPDGRFERFAIEETALLAPKVAQQYPTWKYYVGQGIDDPTATASFDLNINGFHGYVSGINGTYLINPYAENDRVNYIVNYKSDVDRDGDFACNVGNERINFANIEDSLHEGLPPGFSNGANLRTLRLAVAATKEYTNFFGGNTTTAFGGITTSVARMNVIYRRELAVIFQVISNETTVYTNANNGGFPDASNPQVSDLSLAVSQTVLDGAYNDAGYDIGHAVSRTGNPNGLAASPSICSTGNKAQGFTGSQTPQGDGYDVDYLAHEIGHQFGMSHTFNNNVDGSCAGTSRSATSSFEPASGITIMGYGGICGPRNLATNSIEFFHRRSLEQSLAELGNNAPQPMGTCGTTAPTANVPPVVNAGANFTIPRLTPFTLTGSATDATNNGLTYAWEEYDLGGATGSTGDVDTDITGARPIFRSYNPSTSPSRTFPSLPYILNNANTPPATYAVGSSLPNVPQSGSTAGYVCGAVEQNPCITGESLPSIARTMNFRLTVRDNMAAGGGVADATMQVAVATATGPFQITTQNSLAAAPQADWAANSTQTVTWDVAGTNAVPISTANVNILLSTDGGLTFPVTILANTPNDGSQSITVPNNPTTTARIKVEAVGNIYFDINNANFTITPATAAEVTVSGRVLTSGGRGLKNAVVTLTNSNGTTRNVFTGPTGFYQINGVEVGETYIIGVRSRRFSFSPQVIAVTDTLTGVDFIGQ